MPNLTNVYLTDESFAYKTNVTIHGPHFPNPSCLDIANLGYHALVDKYIECWQSQPVRADIVAVSIGSSECNNPSTLDLTTYPQLKNVTIGSDSFGNVREVKLIGLNELERVVIGSRSFTRYTDRYPRYVYQNSHFYLRNCPKLRELRIGSYSFSDYATVEIKNMDALEVIEMGDLNYASYNFYYSSLELKSMDVHSKSWLDLPSLRSLKFGEGAFRTCYSVIFESDSFTSK